MCLGTGTWAGSCEHDNEPSGCIQGASLASQAGLYSRGLVISSVHLYEDY